MHLGIRHIRCFVAVAEELHFGRAAERLSISQPTLSRTIQYIEQEIGVVLFERSNRHVALTDAGTNFLGGCTKALTNIEGAINHALKTTSGETGCLVIGYTDIAIAGELSPILKSFRQRYPDIEVEPRHNYTNAQLEDLEAGVLDFGFLTGPVVRGGYETVTVQRDRFVVVLYESHPLTALSEIPLTALADEPFVLGTTANWTHYHQHLYSLCRLAGFEPNVVQSASNSEGIFGLIACEMGISIQTESVQNYFRKGLEIRPLKDCEETVSTVAIWSETRASPVKQRFIDHLKSYPHRL